MTVQELIDKLQNLTTEQQQQQEVRLSTVDGFDFDSHGVIENEDIIIIW